MHTLIVGRTLSGKSALAKQIGSEFRRRGIECLAFNPTREAGYTRRDNYGCAAAEFETNDPEEFREEILNRIEKEKKIRYIIVDEAHEFFARTDNNDTVWIGTQGRHYGLNVIAITQRGAQINPTFRSQCANLYLFQCSRLDAEYMFNEFGYVELRDAMRMPIGEYYILGPEGIDKGSVF